MASRNAHPVARDRRVGPLLELWVTGARSGGAHGCGACRVMTARSAAAVARLRGIARSKAGNEMSLRTHQGGGVAVAGVVADIDGGVAAAVACGQNVVTSSAEAKGLCSTQGNA